MNYDEKSDCWYYKGEYVGRNKPERFIKSKKVMKQENMMLRV